MDRAETQYLLPDGTRPETAVELLAGALALERERTRSAERRFYDTFDGRLHARDMALVHDAGRLVLVDRTGGSRSFAHQPSAPRRLFASELSQGPLRELLEPVTQVRALTSMARVRSRLHPLRVLDDEAKTVVRLLVEEPVLIGPGRARTPLEPRLRVLPVRGYEEEVARVRETLERDLGMKAAAVSLQDAAVAAAGGPPGGVSTKLEPRRIREERSDHATAAALAGPLATIRATLPGTLADLDSEFLHDFRVAVRRTRSLQRQLKPVFPPEPLVHFRAEFRWLQQATGAVRDLDVHQLDLARFRADAPGPLAADLDPLLALLARRRKTEFRRMVRALRSSRTTELLDGWSRLLEDLAGEDAARPAATGRIGDLVATRIRAVYRQMVGMGRAIDEASPPEALHELRKKGKELRYLLEFFAGLYPADVVGPMLRRLKALQEVLGRYQDQEVQARTLRALGEDLSRGEGAAPVLMAMGLIVERLERDHLVAREEFAGRFEPFAAKDQRKLVKKAFA